MTTNQKINRREMIARSAMVASAVGGMGFFRTHAASTGPSEWITATATRVFDTPDMEAVIEAARLLVSQVEENEPGVIAYICNQNLQNPNEIMFFEIYENEEAINIHQATDYIAEYRDFITGKSSDMMIVDYQGINGFHR